MIYLKSLLAGFIVLFAFIILAMICIIAGLAIFAFTSHGDGAVGWDATALMRSQWWQLLFLAVFASGFFWQLHKLSH
jgi:hypothetical protein